jgi:hypothetical protein
LRFLQREVNLALRRKRSADVRATGKNLRAAVESTMRSLKYPFGNGKLPVRGKPRVSMMVIASAAMTNIRREAKRKDKKSRSRSETDGRGDYEFYCLFLEFPSAWTIQKY